MFHSIVHDFDPRYWSRSATAILLSSGVASAVGTGWLVVELLSRISWFLMQWLLAWLFPPGVVLALMPTPPVAYVVQDVVHDRAIAETVVDLDLGDPGEDAYVDAGDAMLDELDVFAPPPPSDEPDFARALLVGEVEASSKLLAQIIGTTGDSEASVLGVLWSAEDVGNLSGVFGSADLDGELSGGVGGLIGAKGTQIGSGGLGSRGSGLGGGGTAEGLGGLGIGTIGTGSGSAGYGRGSGRVGRGRGSGGQVTAGSSSVTGPRFRDHPTHHPARHGRHPVLLRTRAHQRPQPRGETRAGLRHRTLWERPECLGLVRHHRQLCGVELCHPRGQAHGLPVVRWRHGVGELPVRVQQHRPVIAAPPPQQARRH